MGTDSGSPAMTLPELLLRRTPEISTYQTLRRIKIGQIFKNPADRNRRAGT